MTQEKRPFPIGVENFREIRENNYCYVDKTLFIEEILTGGSKVLLFTRPRRFGKTLNMSTLNCFLNCNMESSQILFEDLKVAQNQKLCEKYMNKHPVFFITLKNLPCNNMEDFYTDFGKYIGEKFQEFHYLLNSEKIFPDEKNWFNSLMSGNSTKSDLKRSLKLITTLLHKHHGVKPWVLIDEYDAPIHSAFQNNQYKECIDFMRDFYGHALKGNENLEKAVLTGILRVSKESIFSGLNNLDVLTVVSPNCASYFGLTEDELKEMLQIYQLEESLPDLKYWYNGYRFGKCSSIYNPWSILNWFRNSEHQFIPYWVNTSSNDLIRTLFFDHKDELQDDIFRLLGGETVQVHLNENLHFPSLQSNCTRQDYFTLLLYAGYVTIKSEDIIKSKYHYNLMIPNQEIQTIFSDIIENWFKQMVPNLKNSLSLEITTALETGDIPTFERHFNDIVLQVMSYHDFAKQPENAFHCFTAGFLSWLSYDYEVKSNRETGEGRADIYLIPKNKDYAGYIFELKAYKPRKKIKTISPATIARHLNLALEQIEDKNYIAEFKGKKAKKIIKIGMLFYGKKVWMKQA